MADGDTPDTIGVDQHNLAPYAINILNLLIRRLPFGTASNVMLGVWVSINAVSP